MSKTKTPVNIDRKETTPVYEIEGKETSAISFICCHCGKKSIGPVFVTEWICNICGGVNL